MVSYSKLSRIAILSFKNGYRLHRDSLLLWQRGSYASATMLSVLAMEEFEYKDTSLIFNSGSLLYQVKCQRAVIFDNLGRVSNPNYQDPVEVKFLGYVARTIKN